MSDTIDVLIVEDDIKLADLLVNYFNRSGYSATHAVDGETALQKLESHSPRLIILDLILPDMDGIYIVQKIRKHFCGKILMLTASGDDLDQITALENGVDDFVNKPIKPRVLQARVKALLRRRCDESPKESPPKSKHLYFGKLNINVNLQRCTLDKEIITLTASEFDLLRFLAENADEVQSREDILKAMRNIEYNGLDRSVDNKISQLRRKLKDTSSPPMGIVTVRNAGYVFISDFW